MTDEEQHEGEDKLTVTPARIDDERFRACAVAVGARLVVGVDLLEVGHPDDAARSRRRDRLHAVLGLAPRNDQSRGPKPTKNSVTFMPERLAAMKWPSLVQHDHER